MTAQRGDSGQAELTYDERLEAIASAYDRLFETRRYLQSTAAFTSGHADCCDVAQARAAALAEQRQGLEQREKTVLSLIEKLEADR